MDDARVNWRRHIFMFLVFVLIGSAINLPLATFFIKSRTADKGKTTFNVIGGQEVASKPWPAPTPHLQPWPPPHQWQEQRSLAYHNIGVWADGHQMLVERTGWPLPVFERVEMWWPWDDPSWRSTAEPDPAMHLYWPGVVINPLLFGAATWLILFAPFIARNALQRRRRMRRGWCLRCAYDLRGKLEDGCPECGWNRRDWEPETRGNTVAVRPSED